MHVFEPRYRRMVADALLTRRTIGMTLLRPGWEAEYAGRPSVYPVGCAGLIERHEALDDGRCNILLRGHSRFRIVQELDPEMRGGAPIRAEFPSWGKAGEVYRLAAVEMLPDAMGDRTSLDGLQRRILAAVARASDGPATLVLQGQVPHESLVNGLCQGLELEPVERQSLLDCDTIEVRAVRLLEILDFHRLERASGRSSSTH